MQQLPRMCLKADKKQTNKKNIQTFLISWLLVKDRLLNETSVSHKSWIPHPRVILFLSLWAEPSNLLLTNRIPQNWSALGYKRFQLLYWSVQFSSVAQSCPTLCDPMNRSMPGLTVHHQLPEFTQTHANRVGDAIQPSHPMSSPSPTALNLSQNQGLFKWVSSSYQVAEAMEFQL